MSILKDIDENLMFYYTKKNLPVSPSIGDTVKVKILLDLGKLQGQNLIKKKKKIQVYTGVVISKHKNIAVMSSTIRVRRTLRKVGIEKVFVLHSPWIKEILVLKRAKVRQSKLYYLRERFGKASRLKPRR